MPLVASSSCCSRSAASLEYSCILASPLPSTTTDITNYEASRTASTATANVYSAPQHVSGENQRTPKNTLSLSAAFAGVASHQTTPPRFLVPAGLSCCRNVAVGAKQKDKLSHRLMTRQRAPNAPRCAVSIARECSSTPREIAVVVSCFASVS